MQAAIYLPSRYHGFALNISGLLILAAIYIYSGCSTNIFMMRHIFVHLLTVYRFIRSLTHAEHFNVRLPHFHDKHCLLYVGPRGSAMQ